MIEHIKKWNGWRKNNLNSKFYKILVLFNIVHSPTFCCYECDCDCEKRDF